MRALEGQISSSILEDHIVFTATSDQTVKWGEMFLLWDCWEDGHDLMLSGCPFRFAQRTSGVVDIKEFQFQLCQWLEYLSCSSEEAIYD